MKKLVLIFAVLAMVNTMVVSGEEAQSKDNQAHSNAPTYQEKGRSYANAEALQKKLLEIINNCTVKRSSEDKAK